MKGIKLTLGYIKYKFNPELSH